MDLTGGGWGRRTGYLRQLGDQSPPRYRFVGAARADAELARLLGRYGPTPVLSAETASGVGRLPGVGRDASGSIGVCQKRVPVVIVPSAGARSAHGVESGRGRGRAANPRYIGEEGSNHRFNARPRGVGYAPRGTSRLASPWASLSRVPCSSAS